MAQGTFGTVVAYPSRKCKPVVLYVIGCVVFSTFALYSDGLRFESLLTD
jgi:uncharacterized membrane protein (Fun14 family)